MELSFRDKDYFEVSLAKDVSVMPFTAKSMMRFFSVSMFHEANMTGNALMRSRLSYKFPENLFLILNISDQGLDICRIYKNYLKTLSSGDREQQFCIHVLVRKAFCELSFGLT